MSATLRIETLGRCSAVVGERRVDASAEMVLALLLMLGLERGRAWPRTELAELLWPDASYSTRAGRLRWLLAKLRVLGLEIENNSSEIGIAVQAVELDVDSIEHVAPESIGQILPLRSTRLSEPFLGWLDERRALLRADAVRRLKPRLHASMNTQAWSRAGVLAAAMRRLDPLDEIATLALAESQFRLGSRHDAVTTIESYLAECGEGTPELQLQANLLLRRIRSVDESGALRAEPRFVGRVEELKRVDGLLFDARGAQGGALVLAGPAGIGKTRLLDEARSRAVMAGLQVVRVRCQRGDVSRPLSGIADLIPQLLDLRGAAGCQPDHLARLRKLANPLPVVEADASSKSGESGDRGNSRPDPQVQRAQLTRALVDLIDAVSSEAPLLLQIDDAQWVDKSLKWLWDDLLSSSQALPVAWLYGFRTSHRDAPAFPIPIVLVGSLEVVFAEELVADLAGLVSRRADPETRAAILSRGAGSPLFIRELVRQWEATGSADSLPTSLRGLIDRGLSGLGKHALRLLQVAAVLGTNATLERIEHICAFPRAAFIDALVELESSGILTADRQGQTFGHVLWAEAALGHLSSAIGALLHRDAAERLEREIEASPVASLLWDAARHWERAGQPERALGAVVRGAEHLFENGFPIDAAAGYLRAENMVQDPRQKLKLLRRRIELLNIGGAFEDVVTEVDRHEALGCDLDFGYCRHNDLELMKVGARTAWGLSLGDCAITAMDCLRNPLNDVAHRLRAARLASMCADFVDPMSLREINDIVLGMDIDAPFHVWDRVRVIWLFERRFGNVARLPSMTESIIALARERNDDRLLSLSLFLRGQAFAVNGRFAAAGSDYWAGAQIARKRGFIHQLIANWDHLIGLSLEADTPDATRSLVDNIMKECADVLSAKEQIRQFPSLQWHRSNLAVVDGRFEEALVLARPLEECLAEVIPRWRVRQLAVQLAARIGLGKTNHLDKIATGMVAAFEYPDDWLDWPATVYANYLDQFVGSEVAKEFARRYVQTVRRELYPAPARLRELAFDGGSSPAADERDSSLMLNLRRVT